MSIHPDETEEFDDCVCDQETDLALLVEIDGDAIWVPKSVVVGEFSQINEYGDEGTLVVKRWWAVQKGLAE